MKKRLLRILTFFLLTVAGVQAAEPWQDKLQQQIPLLGHRNWIVVVDSAYPLQTAPGIETVYAEGDQVAVVKEVIAALSRTQHVKPFEIKPGIGGYTPPFHRFHYQIMSLILPV